MKPTSEILQKSISQINSCFTKEIIPFSIIPSNKNHFVVSVINVRNENKILIDYTFTIKTGKLVKFQIIK